jgi:hypothetical protein
MFAVADPMRALSAAFLAVLKRIGESSGRDARPPRPDKSRDNIDGPRRKK